jgi:hypothetical protein
MSTKLPDPPAAREPRPARSVRAGRVDICVTGDTVTLKLWQRPGVASTVNLVQLERWALRQMREGVFA